MSGIQFDNIPGSGLVAPIFAFEVNSGGQYTSVDRMILVGHKTSAGAIALNTLTPVGSQQDADYYAGPNSMLREMARLAFANAPATPVWLLAVDDATLTARVDTITIGSPALVPGQGVLEINGERISIGITATDTTTTIAAAVAAALNTYYNATSGAQLPMTATSSAAVVTWTAAHKGVLYNEIDIYIPTDVSNVFAISGSVVGANSVAGAGSPTAINTALATLGDSPADVIVCPWSDSTSTGYYTSLTNDVSGRWAWNRQSYGHVFSASRGNFSALTTLGLSLNDRHLSVLGCFAPGSHGTPHMSWQWITAAAARLYPRLTDVTTGSIARAHDGLSLIGIRPPRDRSIWPNYNSLNALNNSGISTWKIAADGTVCLSKVISTYRIGVSGNPDAVFRDVQTLFQASEGLKYTKSRCADLFGQKALANSNPGSLGAIVTPVDIKAGLVAIYSELCNFGVYQDADIFAKLVQVKINANNPDRVDVFMPIETVNPLDILAVNATFYKQYPSTTLNAA